MGMLRHVFRTMTKPYYVAVGETIGDFVYKLIPAVDRAAGNPAGADRELKRFDTALETFARNSDRVTLKIAVEHWAHRVAAPASLAAAAKLFSDPIWFQLACAYLRRFHPLAGNGLAVFQQALKDCGVISIKTLIEELEEMPRPTM